MSYNISYKIEFEKVTLMRDTKVPENLEGTFVITKDSNHKGWLHVLIFVGQIFNRCISSQSFSELKQNFSSIYSDDQTENLCHSQICIGKANDNRLLFAHAIIDKGITTTAYDFRSDEQVTEMVAYRPTDKRIRELYAKHAKQTASNYSERLKIELIDLMGKDPAEKLIARFKKKKRLSPEESGFIKQAKAKLAKDINQFSMPKMMGSAFKRQIISGAEAAKTRAAYAAADLLLGHPLKDENGNLVSYFCTAYAMTLLQGTTFLSCFEDQEQEMYKGLNRDGI